jgi:hypothetical protein
LGGLSLTPEVRAKVLGPKDGVLARPKDGAAFAPPKALGALIFGIVILVGFFIRGILRICQKVVSL